MKHELRKVLALLTVCCFVISMVAACGTQEKAGGETKAPKGTDTVAAGDSDAATDTAAGETEAAGDEDIAEINMTIVCLGGIPKDADAVDAAINEITEKEIYTHVNIERIETGNYEQQIGLKMSGGEKLDLMITMPMKATSFSNMASQGKFMDLTPYLDEYGPGIKETLGDLLSATTMNGKIFAVTGYRSLVTSAYLIMRTDVLEDLGMLDKARNMKSWAEYEEILAAVKASEKWNYLAAIVPSDGHGTCLPLAGCFIGDDNFSDFGVYDELGDLNKIIAVDPHGSESTVNSCLEMDEYKKMVHRMQDWYSKGYVYKDAATTKENAESLVKSNAAFSYFNQSEIGVETAKSTACGMPMTAVKLITLPVSTSSCTKFTWAVPTSATEPEAAVKFLNMMFTDARIANLLSWGIEGTHYQVKDGVAYYMDGEDSTNCGYHTVDFLYGNQFLVWPWDGQPADMRDQAKAEMDDAVVSQYLGFICDTSPLSVELAAVTNVLAEYQPTVDSGMASDDEFNAFIEKLYGSGLDRILEEYQTQLNTWLAAR